MKRCLTIIWIFLLLASCDQVIFPEPQPKKVKPLAEIPPVLQGTYLDQDGDSLFVYSNHFAFTWDDQADLEEYYLSDENVLKAYHDHYFYNTVIDLDSGRFWLTYIISPRSDNSGFDILAMDPDDIVKLAMLQEITSKEKDIEDGDKAYYLFDPRRRHYKKIISDSVFTKMISFRKIR
jgi:hypothetical protein